MVYLFVMPDLMWFVRVDMGFLFNIIGVADIVLPSDLAAVAIMCCDRKSHLFTPPFRAVFPAGSYIAELLFYKKPQE